MLTFDEKYAVIGKLGKPYEGQFFTAVKTTGIFCRPSCRARKPKIENVTFYDTAQAAIKAGYRPCKICKPMALLDETPAPITQLIDCINENPYEKIRDQDLRDKGLSPSTIRRWFKQHYGMTFHSYQRLMRINTAYRQIQRGDTVTHSAQDNGYDSLSGFNTRYKAIFGTNCKNTNQSVITITRFETKLGPMFACATEKGLCLLEFTERRMLENEFLDLRKRLNAVILPGNHPILTKTQTQLDEYFEGKRMTFTIPLDTPTTPFRQAVWDYLQTIPYGQTRSYKEQAIALQKPNAVRAVASANGQNRIAIIIPCHRVIGSDGSLTGYAGGLARKQYLLELEQRGS